MHVIIVYLFGLRYEMNEFTTNEHTGTHIDSPAHFAQNRWTVDQIPVERMIAPGEFLFLFYLNLLVISRNIWFEAVFTFC